MANSMGYDTFLTTEVFLSGWKMDAYCLENYSIHCAFAGQ